MYSVVENSWITVTLNERDRLEREAYTTDWIKRSGLWIMNLNLVSKAWSDHGEMGLMMLFLQRLFFD